MSAKKPLTFTAVSYMVDRSAGGSVRRRQETAFEEIPSPKGTVRFRPVRKTVFAPEAEQEEYDEKMMENAGRAVSDYLSAHAQET